MLAVEDLSVDLGARTLFRGLSFTLEEGRVLVVRGPSGVGKTTLLRALAGLVPDVAGTVRWRGETCAELGAPAWRSRVSWVSQRPPTGSDTPAERLARVQALASQQGRPQDDARALARNWSLAEAAWDQPWSQLSGGECQRAWLATVLSLRPELLLIDEPTSALDPTSSEAVLASLAGHTAVWVTHDPSLAARVADQTLELS